MRINSTFGSREFDEEYRAALEGRRLEAAPRKAGARSLAWLVSRYRESSAWSGLSLATRRARENILKQVLATAGDEDFVAITRKVIVAGRERRKDTPAQANAFLKTMRGLFKWALDVEHVDVDPSKDVAMLTMKSEGHHVWSEDELARYEARWPLGTRERVAFDLLLYTGLRRGDVVRLGRQHVTNGAFSIKTEKTNTLVIAPILPVLEASLRAGPIGDLIFIVGDHGRPMTKESFGNWFREACDAAGVPGSAHGLRKAGATRAANNGATDRQLDAIYGWDGGQQSKNYTKTADRVRHASAAMTLLNRTPTERK